MKHADRAYDRVGRTEPYYGVVALDRFLRANLDATALREFFETGEAQVARVLARIPRDWPRTSSRCARSISAAASDVS